MAPKNKSNKKGHTTEKVVLNDVISGSSLDPVAKILQEVVNAGFTMKEAESAFDQLWMDGLDVENAELATSAIVNHLVSHGEKKENVDVVILKKDESTELTTDDLEKKLQQVASLPNINDVLDGLIRWFNGATKEERLILLNGCIIHTLLLRMLSVKSSLPSNLLSSFFQTIYVIPSEISASLTESFTAIQKYVSDMSVEVSDILSIFEDILRQLGCVDNNSDKFAFMRLANLINLSEESKTAAAAVEDVDPKSQFIRRDLFYKSIKAAYDAVSIARQTPIVKSDSPVKVIDVASRLPIPKDAEQAKEEAEQLSKQLELLLTERETIAGPVMRMASTLASDVSDLTARRDALRIELASVESSLAMKTTALAEAQQILADRQGDYGRRIESVEERLAKAKATATTADACKAITASLEVVQRQCSETQRMRPVPTVDMLLSDTRNYLEAEAECVSFLEVRSQHSKDEADQLSLELQRVGHDEEKAQRLTKLRRSVAGDMQTAAALCKFATGIETMCADEIKDVTDIENNKDILVAIYTLFGRMHVKETISSTFFAVIADSVHANLPKGIIAKDVTPKIAVNKAAVKPATSAVAPVAKVKSTGKKWAVIQNKNVKGVDEIRKEMQAKKE